MKVLVLYNLVSLSPQAKIATSRLDVCDLPGLPACKLLCVYICLVQIVYTMQVVWVCNYIMNDLTLRLVLWGWHAARPHRYNKPVNVGHLLYPGYATHGSLRVRLGPLISVCLTVSYLMITLLCLKHQAHTCLVGRRMRYSCIYEVCVSLTWWCGQKYPTK